jgi:hypothetical protein
MSLRSYLGVVVCRLQTPRLTDGHTKLLQHVSRNNERILVILGDRESPKSHLYPLSFEMRSVMLRNSFPNISIARIFDHPDSQVWSKNLDNIIDVHSCGLSARLYTGRDGFNKHYVGTYPIEEVNVGCDHINATTIRRETTHAGNYHDAGWRAGYIAAYEEMTPRTYETVDMLIEREEDNRILMGETIMEYSISISWGIC